MKRHLQIAKDTFERSNCNNHRAVNQADADRHKLEASGLGGAACARHGNFVPNAMVDFQKGERQMNMDYALCNAVAYNAEGLTKAINFYDINCQYSIKLLERINRNPFLSKDPALEIILGNWHLACPWTPRSLFCQICTQLHKGRQQSRRRNHGDLVVLAEPHLPHLPWDDRRSPKGKPGCSDGIMTRSLSKKYVKAVKGQCESATTFWELNESAPADSIKQWKEEAKAAMDNRGTNPAGMDIFEVKFYKVPTPKVIKLRILADQRTENIGHARGAATWIARGLKVEESQIAIMTDVGSLNDNHATDTQKLELAHRRNCLQMEIDGFQAGAATYYPVGYADDLDADWELDDASDPESDDGAAFFLDPSSNLLMVGEQKDNQDPIGHPAGYVPTTGPKFMGIPIG
ncbi:hypothetical protein BJ138DRAFT_1107385 [Hygrophoropsis aurantiaca]|uniref:Uncharacterized protein n=1 Tax=Hygrophoropsis aurantiaca TaxID=72124 RepID=A0ACB7ZRF8_9AGAM|nr:hypothetical protein BJ138DRAFT_1107385 [Hygrophoropsis aurantiaca]